MVSARTPKAGYELWALLVSPERMILRILLLVQNPVKAFLFGRASMPRKRIFVRFVVLCPVAGDSKVPSILRCGVLQNAGRFEVLSREPADIFRRRFNPFYE